MTEEKYLLGTGINGWKESESQTITFIVTEDCNLRCKYCYISHKSSDKRMSFDTAKKFIDYLLDAPIKRQKAVILDFIGGEPFMEVKLIDKICDYFKLKTFEREDDWYWNYRISICTNGINYLSENVQKFIEKNINKLSIAITIDGVKEKHDMQRVFPDGSGSYDIVLKSVKVWIKQFNASTKVTFSSDDLIYLKESIVELWKMGIKAIAANVVFEDVWKENDDLVLEEQLKSLADYILEEKCFNQYQCSFFDENIGHPYTKEQLTQTSCGAGKMLAVGPEGKIYPCMRYNSYSLDKKQEYIIGNVDEGIDFDKVRPFEAVTYKYQSDEECLKCKVASGCSFCQGFNYDEADSDTNFQRAKYICKMHKARVRANYYYFSKLFNLYGIKSRILQGESSTLSFLLSDNYVDSCLATCDKKSNITMEKKMILQGLEYAARNFYKPIFIYSKNNMYNFIAKEYAAYNILHIIPAEYYKDICGSAKEILPVFNKNNLDVSIDKLENCIYTICGKDILSLSDDLKLIWGKSGRFNLNIIDIDKNTDFDRYKKELELIMEMIIEEYEKNQIFKEVNILTDILFITKHENCGAGEKGYTLAPNGKLYICPLYYSEDENNYIGELESDSLLLKNENLYSQEYAPLCNVCDTYHCMDCIYINKKKTGEVNIPSQTQCRKSHIERQVSLELQNRLKDKIYMKNVLNEIDYMDPLTKMVKEKIGFYKLDKLIV